jgi:hypothetical protein
MHKMKSIFLICFLLPILSFAQTENTTVAQPKNEIGLNLFSINDLSNRNYLENKFTADFSFCSGLYYKFHSGKNVWRTSFDYFQNKIVIDDQQPEFSYSSNGIKKAGEFKAGYERDFSKGKFSPFVFSDLFFQYSKYSGTASESGCFIVFKNLPFNIETFETGISGGAGVKYQITKNIVISLESSLSGFYSISEDLINHAPGYPKTKEYNYRINPLNRLGAAFTF